MILNNLGMVHLEVGQLVEAVQCHDRAWAYFKQAGDEHGAIDAISSRAWTLLSAGDLSLSLAEYRDTGRPRNAAIALRGMAFVLTAMDRFDEATDHVREGREGRELARIPHDILMTINCDAWIHYRTGRFADAGRDYEAALDIAENMENDYEMARSMTGLGNATARLVTTTTLRAGGPRLMGWMCHSTPWWLRRLRRPGIYQPLNLTNRPGRLIPT